jgi:hypothetical protein
MKTIIKNMVLPGLFSLGLISFSSCTKEQMISHNSSLGSILDVKETGTSLVVEDNLEAVISKNIVISESELDILLHMKEEEKLARDVYTALNLKWDNQVFSTISSAENTHMNAIIFLLQDYGTEYTEVLEPGNFTNPAFQALYEELVTRGSASVQEALKVGALIEEMDIKDLSGYLIEISNENIIMVFDNLQKGSRNHLRAFNRQLVKLGLTYTPVYISQDEYDLIVSSQNETGQLYPMNRNGKPGNR